MSATIPVAILQSAPIYGDASACLQKLEHDVEGAARGGAKLIVAGETWLPGYPAWIDHCPDMGLWGHEPTQLLFARLRSQSVTVPGPLCDALSALARAHGVVLVVGVQERVDVGPGSGTLYNAALTFDADGSLRNHHRKLVPTYTERLVWGPGDGAGLQAVETAVGRVGALICWEHWMPLARQAMHDSGEEIHVALWPWVHEIHRLASRHYAFEARCHVLAAGLIHRVRDLPAELAPRDELRDTPDQCLLRGGSTVYAPDGSELVEPTLDAEAIVAVTLDARSRDRESMTLDVSGHYARPDIFDFDVERKRR
jgi:predicted amidohydrolase